MKDVPCNEVALAFARRTCQNAQEVEQFLDRRRSEAPLTVMRFSPRTLQASHPNFDTKIVVHLKGKYFDGMRRGLLSVPHFLMTFLFHVLRIVFSRLCLAQACAFLINSFILEHPYCDRPLLL